jgi:hypothetical protein
MIRDPAAAKGPGMAGPGRPKLKAAVKNVFDGFHGTSDVDAMPGTTVFGAPGREIGFRGPGEPAEGPSAPGPPRGRSGSVGGALAIERREGLAGNRAGGARSGRGAESWPRRAIPIPIPAAKPAAARLMGPRARTLRARRRRGRNGRSRQLRTGGRQSSPASPRAPRSSRGGPEGLWRGQAPVSRPGAGWRGPKCPAASRGGIFFRPVKTGPANRPACQEACPRRNGHNKSIDSIT